MRHVAFSKTLFPLYTLCLGRSLVAVVGMPAPEGVPLKTGGFHYKESLSQACFCGVLGHFLGRLSLATGNDATYDAKAWCGKKSDAVAFLVPDFSAPSLLENNHTSPLYVPLCVRGAYATNRLMPNLVTPFLSPTSLYAAHGLRVVRGYSPFLVFITFRTEYLVARAS